MRFASPIPALASLAFLLAACGGPDFVAGGRSLPIPEDPGIYALRANDELERLDGPAEWERKTWPRRSDLEPGIEFIVLEPGIGRDQAGVNDPARLWRIAWLRSDIEPTGAAGPRSGSEWVLASLDSQSEPVAVTWHPEIRGLFHLAPSRPLEPGLYELVLTRGTGERARVGVLWNSVDKRDYAAANCVDRLIGGQPQFQSCIAPAAYHSEPNLVREARAEAPVATQPNTLRITLGKPSREAGGLRITGTVVNASDRAQRVPMLRGTILDNAGIATDSWVFSAQAASIGPKGEVPFTTWRSAPDGASRLDVDFVGR